MLRDHFAFVFHASTNAALPFLDSATTSTSLVAQWMMTRKLLLYVTSLLYFVFLVLSVMGYRQWKATLNEPGLATAQAA